MLDDLRTRLLDVEPPTGRLLDPSLAVAIAVEADRLAGADILTEDVDDGRYLVVALGYLSIDPRLEVEERFGHRRVERNHRRGTVGRRARCTELKAITRKGERRGAVAVGIVDDEVGDLRDVNLHAPFAFQIKEVILVGEFDMVEEFGELFAEERADDGRRRLVATQTVRIRGADNRSLEEAVMTPDGHERLDDEGDEAQVLLRRLTRSVEEGRTTFFPFSRETPVVVLTRAIDAVERFLVEQDAEPVVAGHPLHERHEEHVVIDGEVALLVDRGEFELVGSDLIVTRLTRDGQFERLYLQILHKRLYTVGNRAEVVVVHLLVFRAFMAHQCASCHEQVGAGRVKAFIDEEVLLFPTEVHLNLTYIIVEITTDLVCRLRDGPDGAEQRRLVVECLARVGDEYGRDTECVVDDEDRRCRIPGRVATRLEGVADAPVGERRSIRFLLDEQFATESLHHAPLAVVFDESIMLLSRPLRERLEPVGVVSCPHVLGLHALSHRISDAAVEPGPIVDDVDEFRIDLGREVAIHLLAVEYVFAEIRRRSFGGSRYLQRLLLESLFYDLESKLV